MSNRNYSQFSYSHEKKPVTIYAVFDGAGTTADPTLMAWKAGALAAAGTGGYKGVKSVVCNSAAGNYTITFQDTFQRLLDVSGFVLSKDGSTAPVANAFYVKAVDPKASGGATINIITYLATIGSLVAPTTNDRWNLSFTFSDSTAQ